MEDREKAVREAIQRAAEEERKSRKNNQGNNKAGDVTESGGGDKNAAGREQGAENEAGASEAGKVDDMQSDNSRQAQEEDVSKQDEQEAGETVTPPEEDEADGEFADETSDDSEDEALDADTEPADGKKKKGSLFKKKVKKDKRDEQIAELNDKIIRQMAEFDNFRKRTEKEKSQMFEVGAKSIIEKILPVIDNFERGLGVLSEEERQGAFAQGMDKIYKQMLTALEEVGVKPIEAVGNEFDPNFHNAVMHEENDEFGENIVSQEFQKGYMYRETVVRHSMVKVAN